MDMTKFVGKVPAVTDVYTDLSGFQSLKGEQDKDVALRKVAQQFESMFVNMMMKSMRSANAVFEENSMFSSQESNFFRDMHDQQLSLTVAHGKGVGIADAMYRQLSRSYGDKDAGEGKFNTPGYSIADYQPGQGKRFSMEQQPLDVQQYIQQASPMVMDARLRSANAPSDQQPVLRTSPSQGMSAEGLHQQTVTEPFAGKKAATSNTHSSSEADARAPSNSRVPIAESPLRFIQKLLPYAQKAADKLGVDKHLLVAQSALETGWGRYVLADQKGQPSNNLFNIKAHGDDPSRVQHATLEFRNGLMCKESAAFRVYDSLEHSFNDYVDFVQGNQRYDAAINAKSEDEYIRELHQAGYATDPDYAEKVLQVYSAVKRLVKDIDLTPVPKENTPPVSDESDADILSSLF